MSDDNIIRLMRTNKGTLTALQEVHTQNARDVKETRELSYSILKLIGRFYGFSSEWIDALNFYLTDSDLDLFGENVDEAFRNLIDAVEFRAVGVTTT